MILEYCVFSRMFEKVSSSSDVWNTSIPTRTPKNFWKHNQRLDHAYELSNCVWIRKKFPFKQYHSAALYSSNWRHLYNLFEKNTRLFWNWRGGSHKAKDSEYDHSSMQPLRTPTKSIKERSSRINKKIEWQFDWISQSRPNAANWKFVVSP